MTSFWYKGANFEGETLFGEMEGDDEDSIANRLLALGISPLTIKPLWRAEDPASAGASSLFIRRPTHADLTRFCWQLSYLLKSGVPLIDALENMERSYTGLGIKLMLRQIIDDLYAGFTLADAMAKHPKSITKLVVNMVRIGESTGRIDEVFHLIFYYLHKQKNLRQRLLSTFKMPLIGLIGIIILVVIVNVAVIPALTDIFKMFSAKLPLSTRVLIAGSNFIIANWHLLLAGLLTLVTSFMVYISTLSGRLLWDRFKIRLPFIGTVLMQFNMVSFVHSLSIAVSSGVHFHHALKLAADSVKNTYFSKSLNEIVHSINTGENFTSAMQRYDIFDSMVVRMMSVGEQTGRFKEMLEEVAEFMDQELDFRVNNLISNLEPMIIVTMGLIVMLLAVGIFLPMWDLVFTLDKPR